MNENSAAPRGLAETAPVAPEKFKILCTRAAAFEERGNIAEALAIYRQIASDLSNKESKSEFGEWVRQTIRRLQEEVQFGRRALPGPQVHSPQTVRPQVAQSVNAALATTYPHSIDATWQLAQTCIHNRDFAGAVAAHEHIESVYAGIEAEGIKLTPQMSSDRENSLLQLASNRRRLKALQQPHQSPKHDPLPANPDLSPEYLRTKTADEMMRMGHRLCDAGRFKEAIVIQQYLVDNFPKERARHASLLEELQNRLEKQVADARSKRSSSKPTYNNSGGFSSGGGDFYM